MILPWPEVLPFPTCSWSCQRRCRHRRRGCLTTRPSPPSWRRDIRRREKTIWTVGVQASDEKKISDDNFDLLWRNLSFVYSWKKRSRKHQLYQQKMFTKCLNQPSTSSIFYLISVCLLTRGPYHLKWPCTYWTLVYNITNHNHETSDINSNN